MDGYSHPGVFDGLKLTHIIEAYMSSDFSLEYLSRETFKELEKELKYLAGAMRREIAKRLEDSISMGDISENAAYEEAKEAQLMNERRIAEIEDLLSRAIVTPDNQSQKIRLKVEVGCFVVLKIEESKDTCRYQLVGSGEADPAENRISNESPIGSALLGKKKGQSVEVLTPRGKISYTIIDVS